ncbi:MAG: WecB/TagA/CpsF family glycosyltransferase, partial [Patescibacteria group bacterium]|nr:WecB/TagA/CpsF family glycosyltransferase [Patescibacteria group bacterium]
IPSAKVGLSVGGSFDYLTGKVRRAPRGLRRLGLEWLWRLFKQPRRWRRIYRATVIFPWRFLIFFFILPMFYRPNIACLLFKRDHGQYKILVVERIGERGHWQLPQGGTDGEGLAVAGVRELEEEINTANFKAVAVFRNLYTYRSDKNLEKQGIRTKNPRGYKGQRQSLFIAEFTGSDSDIKMNPWEHAGWRWVEAEKLVATVHPIRQAAAKIFMEKFWEMIKKNPN